MYDRTGERQTTYHARALMRVRIIHSICFAIVFLLSSILNVSAQDAAVSIRARREGDGYNFRNDGAN